MKKPGQNALCGGYLNNRRIGKDATKPRTLGILGHSDVVTSHISSIFRTLPAQIP